MMRAALVALDGSPHGEATVGLAIDWARRFGAGLVGLGVLDEPSITRPEPVSIGATHFKHERDVKRLAEAHQRVLGFLARFRDRCRDADVACTLLEDVGRPEEQIVREAQSCDVVMLGREMNFRFATEDRDQETLGRVIRESPRPVVVVPDAPATGTGVLVAYGGGREVARTLQIFTCLGLAGVSEDTVDVIAVHPDKAECARRLRHAREYLTAHRVAHHVHPIVSEETPASVIVDEVRRRRPRLLVMGAYGRHPLRDLFVTSVTRAVLRETPVPVFLGA
jgi:nucleotide-binding universal stress UspA family protein